MRINVLKHNLLTDPLIRVRIPGKTDTRMNLPGILAHLHQEEIDSFIGLQAHQTHAWHAFLVQLAAITLTGNIKAFDRSCECSWRNALLELTEGIEGAWCLINDNLQTPAFMQPPVPEKTLKDFDLAYETPDELDILITSKNHDIKQRRLGQPDLDHWIFALISLQTMQGFLGAGNYGIFRMNGGFGNRPCVNFSPTYAFKDRFQRDLSILIANKAKTMDQYGFNPSIPPLLWTIPWDGNVPLEFSSLDPFCIEVCRRIRLSLQEGKPAVYFKPTKAARIQSIDLNGLTADPWTPIQKNLKEPKSLTLNNSKGFEYNIVAEILLTGNYHLELCSKIHHDDQNDLICNLSALVRGQGKTDGYHERNIHIPKKNIPSFLDPEKNQKLTQLSKARIENVNSMSNALKSSLMAFFNTLSKSQLGRKISNELLKFETIVDSKFFEYLFEHLDLDSTLAQSQWMDFLKLSAHSILKQTIEQNSRHSISYYKAVVKAESVFNIMVKKFY